MGLLPALIVKFVFRERLRDYSVGLGIGVRTLRTFRNFAPYFLIAGYLGLKDPTILEKVSVHSPVTV